MRRLLPFVCAVPLLLTGCTATTAEIDDATHPTVTSEASPSGSETVESSGTDPGDVVAIPGDGAEPSPELDVGGPGLMERCETGKLPSPADKVSQSCGGADAAALENGGGVGVVGQKFEPGTYWAAIACDGAGSVVLAFDDVPGLPAEVEVPCAEGALAARQELGTVDDAVEGDWSERATQVGDYVLWLAREGYRG